MNHHHRILHLVLFLSPTHTQTHKRRVHIALTADGASQPDGQLALYLNGVQQAQVGHVYPKAALNGLHVCDYPFLGQSISNFRGFVDELRIWNTAITPDQVSIDEERHVMCFLACFCV